MIKVTLRQILDARDSLGQVGQERLPLKTSYDIAKIIRCCNKELEVFNELKEKILREVNPTGGDLTPEIQTKAVERLNEALDLEVEIPVNRVDLTTNSNLTLAASQILVLEPFFIFEKEEDE